MPDDRRKLNKYVAEHIDEAIEKEAIKIYYQPIIRTLTGEVCGKEALARWEDEKYGLLMPEQFVPVLEEHKLIHKLDSFTIRKICAHYNHCVSRKDPLIPISFNLSWLDFGLCDIIGILNEEMEKNQIPRQMIRVEINESLISHDRELIRGKLDELHKEGYEIVMDDFGSGHSSINILKDYSFDELKIDMKLLWSADEKSKRIIEYLCSMAKCLNMKTLAEGVESEEQVDFLSRIGCEKLQGFYFGEPMFYWDMVPYLKGKGMSAEPASLKEYYDFIGRIDIREKSNISYSIVEFEKENVRYLYANDKYKKNMQSLGVADFGALEQICNEAGSRVNTKFNTMLRHSKERGREQVIDFVWKGNYCISKVRYLIGSQKKEAVEAELINLSMDASVNHLDKVNSALDGVYSIFDRVVELDIDKDRTTVLHRETEYTEKYDSHTYSKNREKYITKEIYADDRERYRQFADFKNAEERIAGSGRNFISGCFRFKNARGNFVWREQYIILARNKGKGRKFLICTKEVDEKQLALLLQLSSFVSKGPAEDKPFDGKSISDAVLWKSAVESCPVGIFWKDVNRRFLGVNRAFLDYYGFEDESEVIGKTDEDMSWHVDPLPFKKDEEDVINNGVTIRDVPGKCIAKGENRDILVNKAPIHIDGKIVGLIGFFRDITERTEKYEALKTISFTDTVTGVLNVRGLMDAVVRYSAAYENNDTDFAMIAININQYHEMREDYGESYADSLMKTVAERIRKRIGNTAVISRPSDNLFLIVRQVEKSEEGPSLMQDISNEVRSVREVDGIPCTIYTSAGYASYSEFSSGETLYAAAVKRMNDQIERMRRFTGGY